MLYSKKIEIIEENSRRTAENVESFMETFFEHCLKWYYQPERFKVTWTRSIIDNSINVRDKVYVDYPNKKDKNIFNKSSELLLEAYIAGKKKAFNATRKDSINKDTFVLNSFETLEAISNLKYVKRWLIENGANDDMIASVNKNTRV